MPRHRSRSLLMLSLAIVAATLGAGCGSAEDLNAAADAFVAGATAPDRSMHLEAEADTILPLVGEVAFASAFDLVGPEYHGTATMYAMGEVVETRLASIGGQSFSAFFGAEHLGGESRPVMTPDPFGGLTRAEVEVVGTDRKDDRDVVHLRVTSPSAAAGAIGTFGHIGLGAVLVDSSTFDLYVTAAGVPVLAEIQVTASATGELAGMIEAEIRIRISRWGELDELPLPFEVVRFPAGTTFVADNRFDETLVWRDAAGHELVVEGCARGTSTDFDGTAFSVEFASDGQAILRMEPAPEPVRHSVVGAVSSGFGGELPILRQESPEPCTGRDGP